MKTLIISSNCSGGGKTTFTLGLMKALKNRNYDVQGYKVGPDYIDTGFHTEITGKVSRNLDLHLMGEEGVKASFSRGKGDLAVVEGVMGLYDGKGLDESCSTYSVSKVLDNSPILLVITPKAQSVTLCAEINGIRDFKNANIVGVVLNCVSEGFYNLLKPAIEMHCGLKVFGYIPKDDAVAADVDRDLLRHDAPVERAGIERGSHRGALVGRRALEGVVAAGRLPDAGMTKARARTVASRRSICFWWSSAASPTPYTVWPADPTGSGAPPSPESGMAYPGGLSVAKGSVISSVRVRNR